MDIPEWGQTLIGKMDRQEARLDEHTAKLDEHTAKLDEHSAKLDEHTAKLDEHTALHASHTANFKAILAKQDEHTARLDRHDVFFADLMVFLQEKFDETQRFSQIQFEALRSEMRAITEVVGGHQTRLERHDQQLDTLEQNDAILKVSVKSLVHRVSTLEQS
jgi:uncharacterized coiled-coil DUF342 family protein